MTDQEIIEKLATEFCGWQRGDIRHEHVWVKDGDYNHAVYVDDFDPLHDPAACALVLDEIERRGWCWELRRDWGSYQFVIYRRPGDEGKLVKQISIAMDGNRYRAVCLAALEAVGA